MTQPDPAGRVQDDDDDDTPMKVCPRCGSSSADYDGFGVLYCPSCGYCSHASVTGGICGLCGKEIRDAQ